MEHIRSFVNELKQFWTPQLGFGDVLEIIIIAFLVYEIMLWIKNTRAWALLKGIIVIMAFIVIASLLEMDTIMWIVTNTFSIVATALIIILQPELRQALEELGKKNVVSSILPFDRGSSDEGLFSDKTVREITKACLEMGKVKTGALIVIAQEDPLTAYERTGIEVDGIVTSQLLINIFEKNTPLHDGAVIVRGNRVVSATCYLPLSDNMELSKELGTRHRAGIGISEVTDSLTLIVSEETGKISIAYKGRLKRGVGKDELETELMRIRKKPEEEKKRKLWRGRAKNEEKADE